MNAIKALSQILRRYTGLNHLAQAARAVLQNGSQITQVIIENYFQTSLICNVVI
jgi:regulatory factor X 1/2/3